MVNVRIKIRSILLFLENMQKYKILLILQDYNNEVAMSEVIIPLPFLDNEVDPNR